MTDIQDKTEMQLPEQPPNLRTTLAIIRTIEAEKRTYLAELRTGIGILTIPLSLMTILIATSNYYDVNAVLSFVVALIIGITALVIIGGYLVFRSLARIKRSERLRKETCFDTECIIRDYVTVDSD
ncbi:MAG: hypothetical protein ACTSPR_06795 [Candidatus Thorarchaeota archaeon]